MNTILVVDDNRTNVALYTRVLSGVADSETVCHTDPFEGLKWCEHHTPALLIVDYRMPKMDGVAFIRRFRTRYTTVPIVMLTAVGSPVLWQLALDAGANEYLMKPIDPHRFVACVERLLAGGEKRGP